MIDIALRATGHLAAWIAWQSMRVSLLPDHQPPAKRGDSDR